MEILPRGAGIVWMFAFILVFLIGTYAVSQLTSLAPRVLQGIAHPSDVLVGVGYLVVTLLSITMLGRMIYSSERAAGRVKRRVRFFE